VLVQPSLLQLQLLVANSPPTFEHQQGDGSFKWQRHVGIAPAQLLGLTGGEWLI
jgi:hypothetical protein